MAERGTGLASRRMQRVFDLFLTYSTVSTAQNRVDQDGNKHLWSTGRPRLHGSLGSALAKAFPRPKKLGRLIDCSLIAVALNVMSKSFKTI